LGRKHRQHLLFEAGVTERRALEVVEIDGTVIGNERRRWHPFYPFEMKRHGYPTSPCRIDPNRAGSPTQSRDWLRERSVDTPQVRLAFAELLPQSGMRRAEILRVLSVFRALCNKPVNDD